MQFIHLRAFLMLPWKVSATLKMATSSTRRTLTSLRQSAARKVVLTGAVGVVSGAAVASITGAEWSNPKYITHTAFFAFVERIVYAL